MKLPQMIQMDPLPADCNPFQHDLYSMGVQVSGRWTAMFDKHVGEEDPAYIIMVNTRTGQRFKLLFDANKDHQESMSNLISARVG
jgi:hypothetical protein